MKEFLILLGWLSLAGSLLGLAVAALGRLNRSRLSRAFCCGLWVLVLLRLVLPVAAPAALGNTTPFARLQAAHREAQLSAEAAQTDGTFSERTEEEAAVSTAQRNESTQSTEAADAAASPLTAAPDSEIPAALLTPEKEPATQTVPMQPESSPGFFSKLLPQLSVLFASLQLPQALFWLWFAGAVFRFFWKLGSYRVFRRRALRQAVPAPLEARIALVCRYDGEHLQLACSPAVHTALLLGVKAPVLLLPPGEPSPAATAAVIRHELAHYRRGDLWLKWAAELVCCIHWFNPLAHWMLREIDRACELACDEAVIRTMNAQEKQIYGETLIAFAGRQGRFAVPLTAICENKARLKERLVRIMRYRRPGIRRRLLSLAACLCLLALLGALGTALGPAPLFVAQAAVSLQDEAPAGPTLSQQAEEIFSILEQVRGNAAVAVVEDITNEYVRTGFVDTGLEPVMSENTGRFVMSGGRLWVFGHSRNTEQSDPFKVQVAGFLPDGSEYCLMDLTLPTPEKEALRGLPKGLWRTHHAEALADCGEERPRVLHSVTTYGLGSAAAPGGDEVWFLSRMDAAGTLEQSIPLELQLQPGWRLQYLCTTPGKLWCALHPTTLEAPFEAGTLMSFSAETGLLLDSFPLPEASVICGAQGLADGRVVLQLITLFAAEGQPACFLQHTLRYVVADPACGSLSRPMLLPQNMSLGSRLAVHPAQSLPDAPSLYCSGFGVYRWNVETNTLSMLASAQSFSDNITLYDTALFVLADGTVLAPQKASSRLVVAEPFPLEG